MKFYIVGINKAFIDRDQLAPAASPPKSKQSKIKKQNKDDLIELERKYPTHDKEFLQSIFKDSNYNLNKVKQLLN